MTEMIQLAKALLETEEDIKQHEDRLKEVKKRAMRLREETIPSAMQELSLTSFKLDTGQVITVKQEVYAIIPKDNQAKAFDWLDEHDFGGLIKSIVKVDFERGELENANKLCAQLEQDGMSPEFTERVHPTTLRAFLREQVAAGNPIPLDLFGARPVWIANIK